MKKKGFTLIELLVVIAIIAMLLAILMPALNKVKKIAQRVVCGTNLKGLGTAQVVYANDYEDMYAQQIYLGPGNPGHTIATNTGDWQQPGKDWSVAMNLTVGASLYLLVREADVSPKSFVCPSGGEFAYDGQNGSNLDITELWDFGNPTAGAGNTGAINCQSYSYHNPYSRFAPDGTRSAAFAVMADKNPYHDEKLTMGGITADNFMDGVGPISPDWNTTGIMSWQIKKANAQPHSRDGQNVMFGDGHNAFEKRTDVGVRHDNIYTPQAGSTINEIRQGLRPPLADYPTNDPVGSSDSYLINDTRCN